MAGQRGPRACGAAGAAAGGCAAAPVNLHVRRCGASNGFHAAAVDVLQQPSNAKCPAAAIDLPKRLASFAMGRLLTLQLVSIHLCCFATRPSRKFRPALPPSLAAATSCRRGSTATCSSTATKSCNARTATMTNTTAPSSRTAGATVGAPLRTRRPQWRVQAQACLDESLSHLPSAGCRACHAMSLSTPSPSQLKAISPSIPPPHKHTHTRTPSTPPAPTFAPTHSPAAAETGLYEALLQSEHRTLDPEEAGGWMGGWMATVQCHCHLRSSLFQLQVVTVHARGTAMARSANFNRSMAAGGR